MFIDYLRNIWIEVSNYSDGRSAELCDQEPDTFIPGETRVYTCPCELYGRYVRIRFAADQRSYLVLCEVQIQSEGKQTIFLCL